MNEVSDIDQTGRFLAGGCNLKSQMIALDVIEIKLG
jgi:hypothetical protein